LGKGNSTLEHKILIIDDDIIAQNILCSTLSGAGYSVIVASNGEEGIGKAAQELPDLIILDIMMPGMDGADVASFLKTNPETENIPIIFLSSLITERSKTNRSKNNEATYLSKPYNGDELLNEVKKYFL
jgi:two-component system sensor histidine kinase/response regulator